MTSDDDYTGPGARASDDPGDDVLEIYLANDDRCVEMIRDIDLQLDEKLVAFMHRIALTPPNVRLHDQYWLAVNFAQNLRANFGEEEAGDFFHERALEMINDIATQN